MQPYFLPYIGYFQLIKAVDKYVIYDDVNFIKRGWINRNNILLDGQSFLFSLNLLKSSQNKLINEIFVSENQTKRLKTIRTAYQKAPYFSSIFPIVEKIFAYDDKNLARFVGNSIIQIANYLQFDTEFIYSSDIKEMNHSLKGQDKILNICEVLGATEYLNAIGGMNLYDKNEFNAKIWNTLIECEYFTVIKITPVGRIYFTIDADFYSVICITGEGEIIYGDKIYEIKKGDSYFLPAGMSDCCIKKTSGNFSFLFTTSGNKIKNN